MFSIKPVKFSLETHLTPKQVCRKLDHSLIQHRPTMNIMSQGRFMREHKFETIFYGCRTEAYKFQVFHHQAKKRDGGTTGFFGTIKETENGTEISGSFRKPVYTYVFAVIWTVISLLLILMCAGLKEYSALLCFAGLWSAGVILMFKDNKISFIQTYLENMLADKNKNKS